VTTPKTVMATEKPVARSIEAELVERAFGAINTDVLPGALGAALLHLSKLAAEMRPDDVSLQLDLPAGTLSFRAYRRPQDRS
jgi:hypothetical protein